MAATRFYIPSTGSGGSGLTPTADAGWGFTTGLTRRDLIRAKYTAPSSILAGSTIGAWANTAGTKAADSQLISPPLAAQTISGTISVMFMAKELATTDNVDRFYLAVKIINSSGVVQSTLLSLGAATGSSTTELTTTMTSTTWANAATLTTQTCSAGDRILVEVGYSNSTTGTTPQAAINFGENATDATVGDNTTTASRAGWVEFSAALTFAAPTVTSCTPNNGPKTGNNTTTVTGTGFYNGSSVTVNGVAATGVIVTSMTSLTCTVPASSVTGAYDVVVTNADSTSGTLTGGYTYNTPTAMEVVFANKGGAEVVLYTDAYSNSAGTWSDSLVVGADFTQSTSSSRPSGTTGLSTGGHFLLYFDGNDEMAGGVIPSALFPTWTNGRTIVEHLIIRRPSNPSGVGDQRIVDYNGNDYWILNTLNPQAMYRAGAQSDSGLAGATLFFMTVEHDVTKKISTMTVNGVPQGVTGTNATGTRLDLLGTKNIASRGGTEFYPGHLGCYGIGWATGWDATARAALYTAMGSWINGAAAANSYTITAARATLGFTGYAVALERGRVLVAASASWAFNGATAGLNYFAAPLVAARATLGFTGNTATLLASRLLTAARQTMGFTGSVATLLASRLLTATKATMVATGNAVGLNHGYYLAAAKSTTVFTGLTANLTAARSLPAAKQTMLFTGIAATLLKGVSLAATKATMVFTGLPANLTAQRYLGATKQTMVFTGLSAALNHGYYLAANQKTMVFTGLAANLNRAVRLTAAQQTVVFTGLAAAFERGYYLNAAKASFVFTGLDAALSTSSNSHTIAAARATLGFSGNTATLLASRLLTASKATLRFTGLDAALAVTMPATKAATVFTGLAAGLTAQRTLAATKATLVFSGLAAALERQLKVTAAQASYVFSGAPATLERGRYLAATQQSIPFTAQTTLLERQLRFTAAQAAYVFSGLPAGLLYSANFHTLAAASAAYPFVSYDVALAYLKAHLARIAWTSQPAARIAWTQDAAARIVWTEQPAAALDWSETPAARIEWRQEMATFNVGDTNRLNFVFYDTDDLDNPKDPASLTAVVVSPLGVRTTYTYGTDSQWTRSETGHYRLSIACTAAKGWSWTVTAVGVVNGAASSSFVVNPVA